MKTYIFLLFILLFGVKNIEAQDVGISGGFFESTIGVGQESELHVTFSNNSFDVSIQPFGAYVQLDFPTTGEYSAPENPPSGPGAQNFTWTLSVEDPNIWIGIVNTEIPPLSSHLIIFTVMGDDITENTPTILFTDLSSGSDNNPQNNNANPLLAISESALPVEFIDFSAEKIDCENVSLNWKTATEINNAGFEILFSQNGTQYEKVGFVKGKGNTHSISEYLFSHNISKLNKNGQLYYRLKQLDSNGLYTFSKTINVRNQCDQNNQLLILGPNPTNGNLNFYFEHELKSNAEVIIINSNNQLIERFEIVASTKNFTKNINSLPKGVYFIKTKSISAEFTNKIVLID